MSLVAVARVNGMRRTPRQTQDGMRRQQQPFTRKTSINQLLRSALCSLIRCENRAPVTRRNAEQSKLTVDIVIGHTQHLSLNPNLLELWYVCAYCATRILFN